MVPPAPGRCFFALCSLFPKKRWGPSKELRQVEQSITWIRGIAIASCQSSASRVLKYPKLQSSCALSAPCLTPWPARQDKLYAHKVVSTWYAASVQRNNCKYSLEFFAHCDTTKVAICPICKFCADGFTTILEICKRQSTMVARKIHGQCAQSFMTPWALMTS